MFSPHRTLGYNPNCTYSFSNKCSTYPFSDKCPHKSTQLSHREVRFGECLRKLQPSTLPLSEGGILCHAKSITKVVKLNAMYSDSVVLKATEVHFLLHQETMEDNKVKQHLKVFFLSTMLPAQSELIYSCHVISILEVYLRPCRTVPQKYLNTCFTTI
jgi:hypothetical protein